MTTIALRASQWSHAPKLRLVPTRGDAAPERDDQRPRHGVVWQSQPASPNGRSPDDDSPVLVAGNDPAARAEVIDSLAAIMPARTLFQVVETFWEVLVRAPLARMVVISGELDGIPSESLLHMLGNRHPELPVISLDGS